MTRRFKLAIRGILAALVLASSVSRAAPAAGERTVQVKVENEVKVGSRDGDLLVEEALLPPGSVIEVSVKSYQNPEQLPYWDKTRDNKGQFVKNIRVVKVPGFSQKDIQEINAWLPVEGLYMSKAQLGEGLVIKDSAKPQTMTLRNPAPIMRNDGPNPKGYPNTYDKDQKISTEEGNALVEQLMQTNRSVGKAGNQVPYCRQCQTFRFYESFIAQGVPPQALQRALQMLERNPGGQIKRQDFMAIADYTKDSKEKRFYLLNLQTGKVSIHYTAHGRRSETRLGHAGRFSDRMGSFMTPPGFHVTSKIGFSQKDGRMVVLKGIEPGVNTNSERRRIYIHGAWYANPEFVRAHGYVGRSQGCIGVPKGELNTILKNLEGGALVYNYTGK